MRQHPGSHSALRLLCLQPTIVLIEVIGRTTSCSSLQENAIVLIVVTAGHGHTSPPAQIARKFPF